MYPFVINFIINSIEMMNHFHIQIHMIRYEFTRIEKVKVFLWSDDGGGSYFKIVLFFSCLLSFFPFLSSYFLAAYFVLLSKDMFKYCLSIRTWYFIFEGFRNGSTLLNFRIRDFYNKKINGVMIQSHLNFCEQDYHISDSDFYRNTKWRNCFNLIIFRPFFWPLLAVLR